MAEGASVAIVTGASGAIGRATVRALSARGLSIVTIDRQELGGPERELVARALNADLRDDMAVADAAIAVRSVGRLSHVVAVAGGGDLDELSQSDQVTESLEIFTQVILNNLVTAFCTIRNMVPLLREGTGNRSITLVGSINAFGGYGAPGYSAAKAGLIGLVNALATPLGADGIRINCLALGTVDTDNLHYLSQARGITLDLAKVAARAPLRRVLTPNDVAGSLAAMALDMSGLTGATVTLDNGQTKIR